MIGAGLNLALGDPESDRKVELRPPSSSPNAGAGPGAVGLELGLSLLISGTGPGPCSGLAGPGKPAACRPSRPTVAGSRSPVPGLGLSGSTIAVLCSESDSGSADRDRPAGSSLRTYVQGSVSAGSIGLCQPACAPCSGSPIRMGSSISSKSRRSASSGRLEGLKFHDQSIAIAYARSMSPIIDANIGT